MSIKIDVINAIEHLKGPENWDRWKEDMTMILTMQGLLSICDGSRERPVVDESAAPETRTATVAKAEQFDKDNAQAKFYLGSLVELQHRVHVTKPALAKEGWSKLFQMFDTATSQRLDKLLSKFHALEFNSEESVTTYVGNLHCHFSEINAELIKKGKNTMDECILMGRILYTLPTEFNTAKSIWETTPEKDRTIDLLMERLRNEEERLKQTKESGSMALRAERSSKRNNRNGSGNCNKHNNYNNPKGNSDKASSSDSNQSGFKGHRSKNMSDSNNDRKFRGKCYGCGKYGHSKKDCKKSDDCDNKENKSAASSAAVLTCFNNDNRPQSWVADTGCSHHMTSDKNIFTSFKPFHIPETIQSANGGKMYAYGSGRIIVEAFVNGKWYERRLEDVWYVPKIERQLISISQSNKHGIDAVFSAVGKCKLTKDNKVLVTGKRESCSQLWLLNLRVKKPEQPACVYLTTPVESLQIMHERLAHQNKRHVAHFLKMRGIDVSKVDEFCEGCVKGKMKSKHHRLREIRATKPGEQINADIVGPMSESSLGGSRYALILKDDYTKFCRIFCLKSKDETPNCIETFLNEARTAGHQVKTLLCDSGTEFINSKLKAILQAHGVKMRTSMTDTPQQNGAAERENRTVIEAARSMVHHKNLPIKLWAEACNTAVYVLNHTAPTPVKDKTPEDLWTGKSTGFKISRLRVFGTKVWYLLQDRYRNGKFAAKSRFGLLVGYEGCDGYRIWDAGRRDIVRTCNVTFEAEKMFDSTIQTRINGIEEHTSSSSEIVLEPAMQVDETQPNNVDNNTEPNNADDVELNDENNIGGPEPEQELRQQRIRHPPKYLEDYVCNCNYALHTVHVPDSYNEAIDSGDAQLWKEAMIDEMTSHAENGTWKLCDLPKGKRALTNRWVYKVKTKADGTIDRAKARLVVRGCSQRLGEEYNELFSPVARYDTVRAILSIAAAQQLKLRQFDIKTAFLYGKIDEEIYMRQPEGFEDSSNRVCKLIKSLYGLKQAPRCWNNCFVEFIRTQGFRASNADPCLFIRERGGNRLFLILYVDDGLIVGSDEDEINELISALKIRFKITTGTPDSFLGMQIKQSKDGIFIGQPAYTERILERFGMLKANSLKMPTEIIDKNEESPDLNEETPYREAVGSLQYLAIATRPDIAFSVGVVARAVSKPTVADWRRVQHIFRYLQGTINIGIYYRSDVNQVAFETYSDADFAGDWRTGRSTTGVMSVYAGGAITWTSKLQSVVSLSTTEAEYIAASEGTKEVKWLKLLFKETIGYKDRPFLNCDNQSAIALTENHVFHRRTKHINVRYHSVREAHVSGELCVRYVNTKRQLADLLTKCFKSSVQFSTLCDQVGLTSNSVVAKDIHLHN